MEVNVHHAKTNLSKLICAAESGEEVVIARNGKPVVRLVRVAAIPPKPRSAMFGAGIGKIWMAEDAFSQETDFEVQALFEGSDDKDEPA